MVFYGLARGRFHPLVAAICRQHLNVLHYLRAKPPVRIKLQNLVVFRRKGRQRLLDGGRYDPGIAEQWSSGIPVISHQAIARHQGVSRQQKRAHCSRTQAPAEIPKAERDSREHRVGHRLIEGGERNTHPPLKPAGQGDSLICAGLLLPAFRPLGQCVKWLAS